MFLERRQQASSPYVCPSVLSYSARFKRELLLSEVDTHRCITIQVFSITVRTRDSFLYVLLLQPIVGPHSPHTFLPRRVLCVYPLPPPWALL